MLHQCLLFLKKIKQTKKKRMSHKSRLVQQSPSLKMDNFNGFTRKELKESELCLPRNISEKLKKGEQKPASTPIFHLNHRKMDKVKFLKCLGLYGSEEIRKRQRLELIVSKIKKRRQIKIRPCKVIVWKLTEAEINRCTKTIQKRRMRCSTKKFTCCKFCENE